MRLNVCSKLSTRRCMSGSPACAPNRLAAFPEKRAPFRPEMAVHGKYGQPCPRCGGKVQRIRYAANETNFCPTCQTGGKLLADRALSRVLPVGFAPLRHAPERAAQ